MSKRIINKMTGDYHAWLIKSLRNKKEAELYLDAALDEYQNDDNVEALFVALRNVAEAQGGIGKLSSVTQLNRETLYRTLSKKGNPKLQTLGLILDGLGFHLSIKAA
jgi:probable addiction module antidote protein